MKSNNFKLFSIIFVIVLLGSQGLYSQVPFTYWSKAYNGPANLQDSSVELCVDGSGNVFVTGWTYSAAAVEDIVTLRYNPSTGDTVWVKKVGGSLQDKPTRIVCDNNSVYVTGWTFGATRDIITIKYNSATGDTTWVRRYNGLNSGGDYGFAMTLDGAGNVYVAGRSDALGGQKMTVLKYDVNGNMVSGWPMVYNGTLATIFDEAHDVHVDGSGNVYVCGRSGATGSEDFLTLKINAGGTVVWGKKYAGAPGLEDNAIGLVLDNTASNIYVGGYGFITSQLQNYIILKYSSNGDSLGFVTYNGLGGQIDIMTAMTGDAANNIYVTGYSTGSGTGYDYATLKYNSNLAQQWVARTSDANNDFPYSIAVGDTSSVYVTGSSIGSGTNYDYLTIKYRSNGSESWRKRENGNSSGNDFASSIAYFDVDHVYVTGSANFTPPGSIVFYTLRYSNLVGIEPISTIVPNDFTLQQNYPNPFNPATTIRFDIPKQSLVNVTVYDVTGRVVEVLANEVVKAGQYKVDWKASGYSSGIYFYTLKTDEFVQTKKMILVK